MVRPLLVPTAFLTLAGLCPACLDETRTDGARTVPQEVVAVAVKPSGNGRTPGYDSAVMGQRGVRRDGGVALVAEPARREEDPAATAPSTVPSSSPAALPSTPVTPSPSSSPPPAPPTPREDAS